MIEYKGMQFASLAELCRYTGVGYSTAHARLAKGMSIEDSVNPNGCANDRRSISCKDHLGKEYASHKEMAEAYGLTWFAVNRRLDLGWTLEQALTTKVGDSKDCAVDHLGNKFCSISKMLDFYGIDRNTYSVRLNRGWSVEDALTVPKGCRRIIHDYA